MAKRFYESGKYRDMWFRRLTPKEKCIWDFFGCECDHAGILKLDFEAMTFHIGAKIAPKDLDFLKEKIIFLDDETVFIPQFVKEQYGPLTETNNAHRGVLKVFEKYGIDPETLTPTQGLGWDLSAPQDKEKEQVQEQKEGDKQGEGTLPRLPAHQRTAQSLQALADDDDFVARHQKAFPHVQIVPEIIKAAAWCYDNPRRGAKKDLARFLNNWFARVVPQAGRFEKDNPADEKQVFFKWFLHERFPQTLNGTDGEIQALWKLNRQFIDAIFAVTKTLLRAKQVTAWAIEDIYEKNDRRWNLGTVAKNIFNLNDDFDTKEFKKRSADIWEN